MTLRVTFEIVPHGDESRKYPIHQLDIHNRGTLEEYLPGGVTMCKYDYELCDVTQDREGTPALSVVDNGFDIEHVREQGALELVTKVLLNLQGYKT